MVSSLTSLIPSLAWAHIPRFIHLLSTSGVQKSSKLTPFPFSNYGTLSPFQITGHLLSFPKYGALLFPFQITGHFLPLSRAWGDHFPSKLRDTFFPLPDYGALLFPFQITGHFLPLSRAWGDHFPSKLRDILFPFPEYGALISRDTLIFPGCTDSGTP